MTVILSHSTARSLYRLQSKQLENAWLNSDDNAFSTAPEPSDIVRARRYLRARGLWGATVEREHIDAIVCHDRLRRAARGSTVHLTRPDLLLGNVCRLEEGLFIVSAKLCALQAASEMTFLELVEYYFELCSSYTLPLEESDDYRTRVPLTSVQELEEFFKGAVGTPGAKLARRAIKYVRDGCRSPLETALIMMIGVPKAEGGLGIRDFEVDYCVPVAFAARDLTRRRFFYFDAYLPRSKTDLEYNGFYHDAEEARAVDEERKNALSSMGYGIISINRHVFFDRAAFARAMTAIMRREGIRPSRLPCGFFVEQERLRKFVLRRYLKDSTVRDAETLDYDPFFDDMQFYS